MMDANHVVRTQLRFGWLLIASFGLLGLCLEALHGFKADWYLLVPVRRSHLLLAHVHGVVFGLVNLLLAGSTVMLPGWSAGGRARAATMMRSGSLLIPIGFLAGGLFVIEERPGIGVVLLAPGVLFLLLGVLMISIACCREGRGST